MHGSTGRLFMTNEDIAFCSVYVKPDLHNEILLNNRMFSNFALKNSEINKSFWRLLACIVYVGLRFCFYSYVHFYTKILVDRLIGKGHFHILGARKHVPF